MTVGARDRAQEFLDAADAEAEEIVEDEKKALAKLNRRIKRDIAKAHETVDEAD